MYFPLVCSMSMWEECIIHSCCMDRPPETAMVSGKGHYFPPQHASINSASSVYLLDLRIGNGDGKSLVLFLAQHSSVHSLVIIRIIRCRNRLFTCTLSLQTCANPPCEQSEKKMTFSAYGHVAKVIKVGQIQSTETSKPWTKTLNPKSVSVWAIADCQCHVAALYVGGLRESLVRFSLNIRCNRCMR